MLFLSKLRHFLDKKAQKSVYYAVFESHLWYASFVWARNTNSVKRLYLLLKKSLKIMFFQSQNFHTGPLFKDSKILRFFSKAALENCIFISKTLKGYCHLFIITGSHFLLSLLDGQVLVVLKYLLIKLKPTVDIQ